MRPGDVVGAIANEAGVPGNGIGAIRITDRFSLVEVPADRAEHVIRAPLERRSIPPRCVGA